MILGFIKNKNTPNDMNYENQRTEILTNTKRECPEIEE